MTRRRLSGIAAALLVCAAMGGCSQAPSTGTVTVEMRSPAEDFPDGIDIEITAADGSTIDSTRVTEGSTVAFEDVPWGWTKIEAEGMCEVEGELAEQAPTMRLVIDGVNCALTD